MNLTSLDVCKAITTIKETGGTEEGPSMMMPPTQSAACHEHEKPCASFLPLYNRWKYCIVMSLNQPVHVYKRMNTDCYPRCSRYCPASGRSSKNNVLIARKSARVKAFALPIKGHWRLTSFNRHFPFSLSLFLSFFPFSIHTPQLFLPSPCCLYRKSNAFR